MAASQTRRLKFGSTAINFELRRSSRRRKTVEISVDPVEGVRVAAPATASLASVDALVKRRAYWILKRLADSRNGASLPPRREFVTGESLDYLGRQYRLRLVNGDARKSGPVRLTRGWLEVVAPATPMKSAGRSATVRMLERWYKTHAESKISQRVQFFSARLGGEPQRVLVRSQERRWGSCGAGKTLRFNWRIIMAPLSVVDYVVVHELCHLRHPDHGRAFWGMVASVLSDYETRRQHLRSEGWRYRL